MEVSPQYRAHELSTRMSPMDTSLWGPWMAVSVPWETKIPGPDNRRELLQDCWNSLSQTMLERAMVVFPQETSTSMAVAVLNTLRDAEMGQGRAKAICKWKK